MWDEKARITLIHAWISSAELGLACGPLSATYLATSSLRWPWVFGIAAIINGLLAIASLGMHESRPSKILSEIVDEVARKASFERLSTHSDQRLPTLAEFVQVSLTQPLRLFTKEPVLLASSVMGAFVYGNLYLFTSALTVVYDEGFGLTARQASLVFLALGIGIIPTFLPRIYDYKLANDRRRKGVPMEPEDKLFGFYVAAPVLAIGLWWFAVTVPPLTNLTPWASIVSLLLIGYATVEFDNVLSGYLTDTYMSSAASANAPMSFLRAVLSGVFPLFGEQMFHHLDSNHALYILASLATGFCLVAVWMWFNAKKLRRASPCAEKTALSARSSEQALVTKEAVPDDEGIELLRV
ncbi:hypothetical protein LTR36_009487 [Oleoguttula mirabilis]|uniref:Major facilitator superfamily (MFS) profile domain-containing protein n=1 Tax=Oleoguttula mirabilis TaxID=1507867 RepID=A0AAV9JSH0_9PEZI|nr:hypothetical protein LTR36_009487 [Oleoguttula mirabilis]